MFASSRWLADLAWFTALWMVASHSSVTLLAHWASGGPYVGWLNTSRNVSSVVRCGGEPLEPPLLLVLPHRPALGVDMSLVSTAVVVASCALPSFRRTSSMRPRVVCAPDCGCLCSPPPSPSGEPHGDGGWELSAGGGGASPSLSMAAPVVLACGSSLLER